MKQIFIGLCIAFTSLIIFTANSYAQTNWDTLPLKKIWDGVEWEKFQFIKE